MVKRTKISFIVLCMAAFMMAGCGKDNAERIETSRAASEAATEEYIPTGESVSESVGFRVVRNNGDMERYIDIYGIRDLASFQETEPSEEFSTEAHTEVESETEALTSEETEASTEETVAVTEAPSETDPSVTAPETTAESVAEPEPAPEPETTPEVVTEPVLETAAATEAPAVPPTEPATEAPTAPPTEAPAPQAPPAPTYVYGDMGCFEIPDVGICVPIFSDWSRYNNNGEAGVICWGSSKCIINHVQMDGFRALQNVPVGAIAYVRHQDGTVTTLQCVRSEAGNASSDQYRFNSDGVGVYEWPGWSTCTCHAWPGVWIVFWQVI